MSDSAFIDQACQKIRRLIAQEKLKEAHKICYELSQQYPKELDFKGLLNEIETEVEEKNQKIAEEKLEEIEPLWKEKKYDKIISELQEIAKAIPSNKIIKQQIEKAKQKYSEQVENLQKEFFSKQRARLEKLLDTNTFEFQSELYILESNNPQNSKIKDMVKELKGELINKKIKEKTELLKSTKHQDIKNFIAELKKIDPQNENLRRLDENTRIRTHKDQIDEKKEYIHSGFSQYEELIKIKKYDKAIKVAEEILKADHRNKAAIKAKRKAEKLFYYHTKSLVIKEIEKSAPAIRKSYKKKPANFIKL
jgi:hypothetical protein